MIGGRTFVKVKRKLPPFGGGEGGSLPAPAVAPLNPFQPAVFAMGAGPEPRRMTALAQAIRDRRVTTRRVRFQDNDQRAALTIQRLFRGAKGRQQVANMILEQERTNQDPYARLVALMNSPEGRQLARAAPAELITSLQRVSPAQQRAATTIQRLFRGSRTRAQVANMILEEERRNQDPYARLVALMNSPEGRRLAREAPAELIPALQRSVPTFASNRRLVADRLGAEIVRGFNLNPVFDRMAVDDMRQNRAARRIQRAFNRYMENLNAGDDLANADDGLNVPAPAVPAAPVPVVAPAAQRVVNVNPMIPRFQDPQFTGGKSLFVRMNTPSFTHTSSGMVPGTSSAPSENRDLGSFRFEYQGNKPVAKRIQLPKNKLLRVLRTKGSI